MKPDRKITLFKCSKTFTIAVNSIIRLILDLVYWTPTFIIITRQSKNSDRTSCLDNWRCRLAPVSSD